MALYNADAIVIRVRDFAEADKIAVLLTREQGKVQAVAKGARRPRNRYAGAMQIFTHMNVALFHGRNMETLSQVEITDSFRHLREDLVRMAYATYCCELIDEVARERQPFDSGFLLLLTTLHLLNTPDMQPEPVLRSFELKLLSQLGFRPSFDSCVECGSLIQTAPGPVIRFAPALGGVLCPDCSGNGEVVFRLTRGTLETLRRLLEGDIRRAHVIRIAGETVVEIDRLLSAYISHRTERPLKSKEFLDMLRQ